MNYLAAINVIIGLCGVMKLSRDNTQYWDESLKKGEIWVNRVSLAADRFIQENNLKPKKPKIIPFTTEKNKTLQKNGIDAQVNTVYNIEVKTRFDLRYYNIDIALETISVVENNTKGWIYTSKADFIAYVWGTKQILMDIGYLIDLEKLRKNSIYKKIQTYPTIKTYSDSWSTIGHTIPMHKFPEGTLYRFNPNNIPKNDISNWGGY